MQPRSRRLAVLATLVFLPAIAIAYGTRVHQAVPMRALAAARALDGAVVARDTLPGITDADLAQFRGWLYERARGIGDTAVRRAFLARYPSAAAFDARAMKELLMMDGAGRVLGVDSFAAVYRAMRPGDRRGDPHPDYIPGSPMTLATALELGSIYPDLDRRNQRRLLRDSALTLVRTATGDSVPFDPMSLNMGGLAGLSSQAHAHYGLNRHPKSADPATLKTAPWDFAIATGFEGPVETYASDNAQFYSDLAVLAALDGRPWGRTLSALWAGNAIHYVADVGNAIHTVQVGIYPIFVDATIQYWMRRSLHLFGLLGRSKSRNAIGLDIITNLHTLSERLFEVELNDAMKDEAAGRPDRPRASMQHVLRAFTAGSDSLSRVLADTLGVLRRAGDTPDFARAIAATLVDAGNRDGAEVYRLARDLARARLRAGTWVMDFDTVSETRVWHFVRVHSGALIHTALDDFNETQARGLARTTSALRSWWAEYLREASAPADRRPAVIDRVVTRLIAERLRYLDAAEARRRAWIARHGGPASR
jgi:hypothetical protein